MCFLSYQSVFMEKSFNGVVQRALTSATITEAWQAAEGPHVSVTKVHALLPLLTLQKQKDRSVSYSPVTNKTDCYRVAPPVSCAN